MKKEIISLESVVWVKNSGMDGMGGRGKKLAMMVIGSNDIEWQLIPV